MGYGRKRYDPQIKKNTTFGLNITSMTDMFTILLVFLLQTYSTSQVEIIPENDIRLPSSMTDSNPVESIKMSLSSHELKLEGKIIATLKDSDFTKVDTDSHDSNFILPLFKELQKISKDNESKEAAAPSDTPTQKAETIHAIKEGKILLQADQSLNYGVLRKVMYTASMAGFPKLKLATVVGE
jgi:biopolymer transport protein ExbD